jgi:hypothetical protein
MPANVIETDRLQVLLYEVDAATAAAAVVSKKNHSSTT